MITVLFCLRNLGEFPKILAIAVDTLLISCDDGESDVRFVAGECLNKLIKVNFLCKAIEELQCAISKVL